MSAKPLIADYFADFGARLARLVRERGLEIEPPAITYPAAAAVLELAGTVAHTSERKFAPLASFVTGIAVGELRAAGRLRSDSEVVAFVAELNGELDLAMVRQSPDENPRGMMDE